MNVNNHQVIPVRFNQMRTFLAVVDAGSIHAAARVLGVSQPAVTKTLRALEEDLHVRLLERTRQGVVLTRAGATLVTRARTIQSELRKANEELALIAGEREGSVAFGVSHVAIPILPVAIARFQEQFPRARVRIVERVWSTMVPMIRDETLDFMVGRPPDGQRDPAIAVRPLFQSEMVIVARAGHPKARTHSLTELRDHGWITFVPPESSSLLRRAFVSARIEPPETLIYCESISAAFALIRETELVMMIPKSLLAKPSTGEGIRVIPIQETLPTQIVSLYKRADSRLAPVAAAMVDAVVAAARRFVREKTKAQDGL